MRLEYCSEFAVYPPSDVSKNAGRSFQAIVLLSRSPCIRGSNERPGTPTGVGAPALYPYIPNQLRGILGAIKAAAEYEQALIEKFPDLKENKNSQEGLRRMGPQLVAPLLIIGLIVVGNIICFVDRKRGTAS